MSCAIEIGSDGGQTVVRIFQGNDLLDVVRLSPDDVALIAAKLLRTHHRLADAGEGRPPEPPLMQMSPADEMSFLVSSMGDQVAVAFRIGQTSIGFELPPESVGIVVAAFEQWRQRGQLKAATDNPTQH